MNALNIIDKYYPEENELKRILLTHSRSVADKALWIADKHPELNLDKAFLEEAAMLHDIGIFLTDAPGIFCFGDKPYICHGYLGADLLREEGFPRHALVCERHTGAGISAESIIKQDLPIPHREMLPEFDLVILAPQVASNFEDMKAETDKLGIKLAKTEGGQYIKLTRDGKGALAFVQAQFEE